MNGKCPKCGAEMGPPVIEARSYGEHEESYVVEYSYCLGNENYDDCGYRRCEGMSLE